MFFIGDIVQCVDSNLNLKLGLLSIHKVGLAGRNGFETVESYKMPYSQMGWTYGYDSFVLLRNSPHITELERELI